MATSDVAPARKPASAYQMFAAKYRPEVMEELKNGAGGKVPQLGEVQKALGKKWSEMSAEAKAELEAEFQKEKERFEVASLRIPEESERLQELRRRRQESVPEVLASAREIFTADSTERTRVQGELQAPDAAEPPSGESVTARLQEQWVAMSEEAQQQWQESLRSQTEARAEKLSAWERLPEAEELRRLEQEHAAAVAAAAAAAPAQARRGRGRGRGRGGAEKAPAATADEEPQEAAAGESPGAAATGEAPAAAAAASPAGGRGRGKGRGRGRGRGRGAEASVTPPEQPAPPASAATEEAAPAAQSAEQAQEAQLTTPSKKRSRVVADKEVQETSPAPVNQPTQEHSPDSLGLDEETLKKARRKGLQGALFNLASRDEIKAHAFKGAELLDALRKCGGLVNPAKRTLLEERAQVNVA